MQFSNFGGVFIRFKKTQLFDISEKACYKKCIYKKTVIGDGNFIIGIDRYDHPLLHLLGHFSELCC